jgi:hypothetical protein
LVVITIDTIVTVAYKPTYNVFDGSFAPKRNNDRGHRHPGCLVTAKMGIPALGIKPEDH